MHADAAASAPTGLRAALILFATNGALYGVWVVRIPDIKIALDLGEGVLGLVLLAAAVGAVVSFGLSARIADRFGAGRVAIAFCIAMALVVPCLAFAPGPVTLALGLFFLGAFGGSMDLVMNAYATEVEKRARRARMSLLHGSWSVGMAASSGAAAFGLARLDPALHFALGGTLALIAATVAAALIVDPGPQPGGAGKRAALIALPRGAMIPLAAITALAFLIEGAAMDWGGVYVREVLGGSVEQGAAALTLLSLAVMAVRLVGDPITDRLGPARAARICAAGVALGALIASLAATPAIALAGLTVLGAGLSLMAPIGFSGAGRLATSGSGEAVAAVAFMGYAGILLGPVIMGLTGELFGLPTSFAILAGGGIALFVVAGRIGRGPST
ncbi:MFS transporter [Roseobacter sp. HKCCA0434]|uniref:MFS transporter n=1 Tax=Roseobacter sp. HKCCA0434 TaxID=3079297 RepID=UPI002905E5CB|nr:MFS transporter [Roseobacter sp. HKCCA0434]